MIFEWYIQTWVQQPFGPEFMVLVGRYFFFESGISSQVGVPISLDSSEIFNLLSGPGPVRGMNILVRGSLDFNSPLGFLVFSRIKKRHANCFDLMIGLIKFNMFEYSLMCSLSEHLVHLFSFWYQERRNFLEHNFCWT